MLDVVHEKVINLDGFRMSIGANRMGAIPTQ